MSDPTFVFVTHAEPTTDDVTVTIASAVQVGLVLDRAAQARLHAELSRHLGYERLRSDPGLREAFAAGACWRGNTTAPESATDTAYDAWVRGWVAGW